jgi:hypothetical protein
MRVLLVKSTPAIPAIARDSSCRRHHSSKNAFPCVLFCLVEIQTMQSRVLSIQYLVAHFVIYFTDLFSNEFAPIAGYNHRALDGRSSHFPRC